MLRSVRSIQYSLSLLCPLLAPQAKTCEELQLETYAAKQETLQAREKLKRIERARRAAASAKEVRSAAVDRLKKSTL